MLPNKDLKVQVCDATKFNSSNTAHYIKKILYHFNCKSLKAAPALPLLLIDISLPASTQQ